MQNQSVSDFSYAGYEAVAPLSALVLSHLNIRKTKPTGIEALAASILAESQLQNLIVVKIEGKDGQYGVIGGGRRLAAMKLLARKHKISADYPVRLWVVPEEMAQEVSLAENIKRENLHPADEFEAFKLLVDTGKGVEEIAARFGVTPIVVQRRLKLANISPRLLDLYRQNDEITLEHLMALALTDDHERQESIWYSAQHWQRNPTHLKNMLTEAEIDVRRDRTARFVGLEAYEAAGGAVRRDLFSDDANAGYILDAELLNGLAAEKLEVTRGAVLQEGWAWVEIMDSFGYEQRSRFSKVGTVERTPTAAEAEQLEQWDTILNDLQQRADEAEEYDDDAYEKMQELEEQRSQLTESLQVPDPKDAAISGAVICISHNGNLEVHRGLVKAEDRKRITADKEVGHAAETTPAPRKPEYSERLYRQLSANRTAAVQASLTANVEVALVALAHRMVAQVFFACGFQTPQIQVRLESSSLDREAPDISETRASKIMTAEYDRWKAVLPEDAEQLFSWLIQIQQHELLELIAFCTATSFNDVTSNGRMGAVSAQIAAALELNMADWWQPTESSFLGSVSKARILSVVQEAKGAEVAESLKGLKKKQLVKAAEDSLAGTRWVPEVLQVA